MRKLILTSMLALGMVVVPATAMAKPMKHAAHAMKEKTLYERLGGAPAVSAVIDDFAGRVLADTRINAKFAKSDPTRLVANLKTFVTQATGGPKVYKGQSMAAAHHNMGVTDAEFGALVEDLVATLDKFNVPAKEKGELLAALGPLGPQIVSVHSNETGGALPASFKPAPAAKK
ncbi:group 1 truncated hemoglobin [Novosphingobium sp.]|uniref:group I truncated hemoglobin n=1 Tax=Novosphingobium sp. TaxID=1874826 RepID=UPI0025F0E32F|nr:group 1 truncated hemoglobin [Novosphingobium sp.]